MTDVRLHCVQSHDLRPETTMTLDEIIAWHAMDHTVVRTHRHDLSRLHNAAGACEPDYHRLLPGSQRCRCGAAIECPRCERVSFNPNDVAERYCGACHMYHDQMDLTT